MSKGKILVVDDEIYIVHILDFSLGMEGYEVVTALDGEQALEKARSARPDLIVLDIMMPKLDGYEVCKAVKADPATKHIPIVAVTAHALPGDRERSFQAGCDGYLAKPCEPRAVVAEVQRFLGKDNGR